MTTLGWAALVLFAAAIEDSPRQEISLNGTWECQRVEELNQPPALGAWTPLAVPGYLRGTNYQRAWLRRSFDVPSSMRGKRLTIRFGGVKYNSRVLVNGRQVGGCFGGYEPFEVEVTEAVRFDGPNELAVGCHDWTGVFSPGKVEFPAQADWDVVRGVPRDKVLSPVGGLYGLYGIWDDVTLIARPPVHVKDLFIKPSVRRGELTVEYEIANRSAADAEVELRAVVEDQGRGVLELGPTRLKVPAGKTAPATLRQSWAKPILWSPADPHLLDLRTTVARTPGLAEPGSKATSADSKPALELDVLRTRFGFREFWTEGHKFYLNGSRINLLATSWWPPHDVMTRDEIRKHWEAVKRAGCVAFRTHTQPWPSLHYEVADELGLLMIIEGAVWNDDDIYRIHDPVFWDNYARHLRAMVDRDKNRPSVVMWSLENEFFGGRLNDASPAKSDLVRMGRLVKEHDPTRPILYESDGDPGGVADVIGIHYPHEYPDYTCWPNEADWLDRPQRLDQMFLNGQKEFFWRKDKPLYVGEFLWIPSRDPSWHTVFFGDEAYLDYHRYRNLAKAESWKMQILGYRRHEVAGISPWTVIEGGPLDETNPLYRAHQYAYQPVAAYATDYDRRFFSGETVTRHLAVVHDAPESKTLELRWSLSAAGKVGEGRRELRLGPGEQQSVEVPLVMPGVNAPTPAAWRVSVRRDGAEVFGDTHWYAVFPRISLPSPAVPIGLYDPAGTTRKLFESSGLKTTPVAALDRLPEGLAVLVIGAGTLQAKAAGEPVIGRVAPERKTLVDFVTRGGRVLVLRQDAYPEGLFDVNLGNHRSTMTFALQADHPALRGIEPDDLKFWRGDHLVTAHEPTRPVSGASSAIVVSGSSAGLDHAPLLECPAGRGTVVYCQMLLVEKFQSEPSAARILANLLDYLASYQARPRKTALVGGDASYREHLRSLGLRFDDLGSGIASVDPAAYSLLICRGDVPHAQLARWLDAGASVLLHRIPAGLVGQVSSLARADNGKPAGKPVLRGQ
ncbi:MAG: hypothetical protein NUV77_10075, partial [Thermoguttaceae bacterium]|nr:hypothetical protein [Thermoguttaceae bacterium]